MDKLIDELKWYFAKGKKGHLFGTNIKLYLPMNAEYEGEFADLKSTVNTTPGRENIGFYDVVLNTQTFQKNHINFGYCDEREKGAEDIQQAIDSHSWPENILCTRRWYYSQAPFFGLMFTNELWVYRNAESGDLRDETSLRKAHQYFLAVDAVHQHRHKHKKDDDLELFAEQPHISGINWRSKIMNQQKWLCCDEYRNSTFFAENWLRPIGKHHYIVARVYGPMAQTDWKPVTLRRYTRRFFSRISIKSNSQITPPSTDNQKLSMPMTAIPEHVQHIMAEQKAYLEQVQKRELSQETHVSSHKKIWQYLFSGSVGKSLGGFTFILLCALGFFSFLRGMFVLQQYVGVALALTMAAYIWGHDSLDKYFERREKAKDENDETG